MQPYAHCCAARGLHSIPANGMCAMPVGCNPAGRRLLAATVVCCPVRKPGTHVLASLWDHIYLIYGCASLDASRCKQPIACRDNKTFPCAQLYVATCFYPAFVGIRRPSSDKLINKRFKVAIQGWRSLGWAGRDGHVRRAGSSLLGRGRQEKLRSRQREKWHIYKKQGSERENVFRNTR